VLCAVPTEIGFKSGGIKLDFASGENINVGE